MTIIGVSVKKKIYFNKIFIKNLNAGEAVKMWLNILKTLLKWGDQVLKKEA